MDCPDGAGWRSDGRGRRAADAAKQSLDQAANDPTASLMAVQFQNVYAGAYHNLVDEAGNTVLLRL